MCMKKVFSLQFHAGKRRDDILKDPGTNQRCFVMMDFSQTPIISSEHELQIHTAGQMETLQIQWGLFGGPNS